MKRVRQVSAYAQPLARSSVVHDAWTRPLVEHLAGDAAHVWHPYTSAAHSSRLWSVASARGVKLCLEGGQEVIDGMSSWWSAVHGYNNEVLNTAARDQLSRCSHVMFGGLTHRPAVALCELLVDIVPGKLNRVFLCDSGSVSVEVAIKLALQYWRAQGRPAKSRLLACRGAYHGDTFGAMACCDPVNGMHAELFDAVLPRHIFAPRPDVRFGTRPGVCDDRRSARHNQPSSAADELERIIDLHADELAALIIEPIVQGAGGKIVFARPH